MPVEAIAHLSDRQTADLHRLYQDEWWTAGRARDDVETMLTESDVIVAFCDEATDELVAFSRVLTDGVYKALVLDVIVSPDHRGTGLGRRLMDAIVTHPDLSEVDQFELYCLEELVPFYERWGFTDELSGLRLMRRD